METIAFLIALFAVFLARKANIRSREINARLVQLEASFAGATTSRASAPSSMEAPVAPSISPETIETTAEIAPPPFEPASSSVEAPADAIPPEALPEQVAVARPGLEERLGTRWVVWIGGLTLALGGLFLVKYSIEAGLLGPGVRVLLGGLFALALLGAGEFTRRKENTSSAAPLAIANIPGHSHRSWHCRGICYGIRRIRAVRISRAADGIRTSRTGRTGNTGCSAVAWTRAGRPRRGWRIHHAGSCVIGHAGLLGVVYLHRDRHRRGLRARPHSLVAMACPNDHCVRRRVDVVRHLGAGNARASCLRHRRELCTRRACLW